MTIHANDTTGRVLRLLDEITSLWGASTLILIAATNTFTWTTFPRGLLIATALTGIIHNARRWNQ